MRKRVAAAGIGAMALAIVSSSSADDAKDTGISPSQQYAAEITRVEKLGAILYEQEEAEYAAALQVAAQIDGRFSDWIAQRIESGWRVLFLSRPNDAPNILFAVDLVNGQVMPGSVHSYPSGQPLDATQADIYRAQQTALTAAPPKCSPAYAAEVVPLAGMIEGKTGFYVYILLGPSADGPSIQIGGHQRVEVDQTGTHVVEVRQFSRSCLALNSPPGTVGLFVTHLLAPYPEEPHVFISLASKLTLYVSTTENHQNWKVEAGRISPFK